MAVGDWPWCDFVAYTTKGISIQRINFDSTFWENRLLPKLIDYYDNCVAPEIVSSVHVLGLPVRHLKKLTSEVEAASIVHVNTQNNIYTPYTHPHIYEQQVL